MILVAYAKADGKVKDLDFSVRQAFPNANNKRFIDGITARKNEESVSNSLTALVLLARLAGKMGAELDKLILCREENGRPFFENSSLDFSITHSHNVVAVALSDQGRVGIDVEASDMSIERAGRLAERYLSEKEASSLSSVEDFLRIWTEREAYVKQSGAPLTDALKNGIECDVEICHFEILGYPASICFVGEQKIEIITL